MSYVTVDQIKAFVGSIKGVPVTDQQAADAYAYAKAAIDSFCNTAFEEPESDSIYYFDGTGRRTILSPEEAGPFAEVAKVEYRSDDTWYEYEDDYWVKEPGIVLESTMTKGVQNWRITAKCWTELPAFKQTLLERVTLLLAKWYLVERDEPWGRSVASIGSEGLTYSYQPVNEGNPTGNVEIDGLLRTLRRRVVRSG